MRNYSLFAIVLCFVALFFICLPKAKATPETTNVDYTDYMPKYRTMTSGFMLAKIDYTPEEMIVFFRYVAYKENDKITFHGAKTEYAWRLTTSAPTQISSVYSVTRLAEIQNIRINDESQIKLLDPDEKKEFIAQKGDVITCEVHFKVMPRTVRTVHMLGGDIDGQGTFRFNCNDILIKYKESSMLASEEFMNIAIKRFYDKQSYVSYPDIKDVTSANELEELEEVKKTAIPKPVNPLEKALEPIDYMPKSMTSTADMGCNQRVILTNVYFRDNKSDFSVRAKAMKTINLIVEYLEFHPKSRIVLHGHTDIFGNSFNNLELSKKRVLMVKRTMVTKGIDANRVITVHHGGSQPLLQYKQGGEMNRRVEAEVLCPK
jgi:outer membrane protein OmpA-like peptidoglycan-associated protein